MRNKDVTPQFKTAEFDPDFASYFPIDGFTIEIMQTVADDHILIAMEKVYVADHIQCAVVRLLPDGDLDQDFGEGGYCYFDFKEHRALDSGRWAGLHILPDGKILCRMVVRTMLDNSPIETLGLARLTTAGALDKSFGQQGYVMHVFPTPKGTAQEGSSPPLPSGGNDSPSPTVFSKIPQQYGGFELLADGKMLILAATNRWEWEGSHSYMIRVLPNGKLDTTFHDTGYLKLNTGYLFIPGNFVSQPTGYVINGYRHLFKGTHDTLVARVDENGNLDARFAQNGFFSYSTENGLVRWDGLIPLESGLLLVGRVFPVTDLPRDPGEIVLTLLTADGQLDNQFNNGSPVSFSFNMVTMGFPQILLDEQQRITCCASVSDTALPYLHPIIIKYNYDGTPDTDFGDAQGIRALPGHDMIRAMTEQSGKGLIIATRQPSNVLRMLN